MKITQRENTNPTAHKLKTEGILSSLKSMLGYELLTILAQTAAELQNKSTIGILQYDRDKATPF